MELQKGVKCVIFDLDGTLADFPIDYNAMRKELKDYFSGFGKSSEFTPLMPEIRRIADENQLKAALGIVDKYELASVKKAVLNDKAIVAYKSAGALHPCILTRNGRKMVERFLEEYRLPKPKAVCSRDDAVNLKPHREQLDFIRAGFKFKSGDYLLVGDSSHDYELAKNNGIGFLDVKSL